MSVSAPNAPASHMELRRLCDDISHLGSGVHADILKHLDHSMLTRNGNGVFFDLADVSQDTLARVKKVVEYAKGTHAKLAEHDRKLFENAQRLVSGPIGTVADLDAANGAGQSSPASAGPPPGVPKTEGEEAFAVKMETGCVSKPAKGVFSKKYA